MSPRSLPAEPAVAGRRAPRSLPGESAVGPGGLRGRVSLGSAHVGGTAARCTSPPFPAPGRPSGGGNRLRGGAGDSSGVGSPDVRYRPTRQRLRRCGTCSRRTVKQVSGPSALGRTRVPVSRTPCCREPLVVGGGSGVAALLAGMRCTGSDEVRARVGGGLGPRCGSGRGRARVGGGLGPRCGSGEVRARDGADDSGQVRAGGAHDARRASMSGICQSLRGAAQGMFGAGLCGPAASINVPRGQSMIRGCAACPSPLPAVGPRCGGRAWRFVVTVGGGGGVGRGSVRVDGLLFRGSMGS